MANSKFDKVLDAIEADLQTLAKSAAHDLAKVHPGEDTSSESPVDTSATAPEGSAPPPGLDAPPPADAGGPPPGPPPGPPGDASAAPPPGAPGEGAGDQPPTHEQLVQALSELPPEMLAMYKAAIDEVMAQHGGGEGSPEASPPAPPASPPPPEMGKSEDLAKAEQMNGQIVELRKALQAVKADLAKSQDETAQAAKAIETFLSQPNRRAITSAVETAPAQEEVSSLDKAEILGRLRKASHSTERTPAERKAINDYVFRGGSLDPIKHLVVNPAS